MNTSNLFTVLTSMALSGVVVAIIQALSQRKNVDATQAKTKAEAARVSAEEAEILSRIAVDAGKNAAEDVARIRQELRDVRAAFRAHREWDKAMMKIVRDLDPTIEIADPPELFA